MNQVGYGWLPARDRWKASHPKLLADLKQTLPSSLRDRALVNKEYKNYIQLSHSSWFRQRAITFAPKARQASCTHPRRNLKVIGEIWGLKIPRKRTCEHPQRLDSFADILTDAQSKLVSGPCSASPQFTSILLILDNTQKSHCKTFQIRCIHLGCS